MIKLVVAGAVTVAGAAVGLGAAGSSGATTPPACTAGHLKPVYGGSQGAAGTLQDTWRLRNVGGVTCTVSGFPDVHNYRADGRPLPTSLTHTGTAVTVLLAPNQHASFALRYTNPAILGCTPEPAAMLTIRVPADALPVIASRGERACHGRLTETALIHGG